MNRTPRPRTPARRPAGAGRHLAAAAAALAAVTVVPLTTAPVAARAATTPAPAIRLIAAPGPVVGADGAIWSPDARFADGGSTWVSTSAIGGTTDDAVFRAERWGLRGYSVPVPASGSYRVTLNAAELVFTGAGQRRFSVTAEGRAVASGIDLVAAVGAKNAWSTTFTTTVTDGRLDLAFTADVNAAKVSSLLIAPVVASPLVARAVAGTSPVTDAAGRVWSPDARLADGGTTWTSTAAIAGTTDDRLFQPERWGVRGYDVPVPGPGSYRVTLNAAEVAFTAAGQRVFGVVAEGRQVLSGVDLVKAVGARTAYTASFTTTVTDGSLTLRLPATVNHAKVSSLVVEAASAVAPTSPPPAATSVLGGPMTVDPTSARGGPFGASSVWRTDLRTAPVAANSAALVSNLTAQVNRYYAGNAAFNVWQYGGNVYTVAPGQPRVDVRWDDCQGKGSVPTGLLGPGGQFTSVPIPSDAVPTVGTDASMSIHQPATDTLWSFWKLARKADGWHACWGGRIDGASSSPGWYPGGFGVSATGLAVEGGIVNIRDVQAGRIDHALALGLLSTAQWKSFSWPAQRSDGFDTAADAIPEGTRLRLDASVDVDALALSPIGKMIARAAQTYGFIVTDKAGVVGIGAEGGSGVRTRTGTNPWDTLLGATPSYAVLAGFPWSRLRALPKDYGKP